MNKIQYHSLGPEHLALLEDFFEKIAQEKNIENFHPHPFNKDAARKICEQKTKDLYTVGIESEGISAYGMLRGWDEGYSIPSLGIFLTLESRGTGLASAFMHHLHGEAQKRGASEVILKVYPDNFAAIKLYKKLGYQFSQRQDGDNGQLLGRLHL